MSDFGALLEYAMQLEAEAPAGTIAKLEAIRPATMGATKAEREAAAKPPPAAPADDKKK